MIIPETKSSILDSEEMESVIQGTKGAGSRVQVVDVTGDIINIEIGGVIFRVRTTTDELYVIDTTGSHTGSTFLVERTTDAKLSLVVLLQVYFTLYFAVGKDGDPYLGGIFRTSEGIAGQVVFHHNL
jgi:hypothetical protein